MAKRKGIFDFNRDGKVNFYERAVKYKVMHDIFCDEEEKDSDDILSDDFDSDFDSDSDDGFDF